MLNSFKPQHEMVFIRIHVGTRLAILIAQCMATVQFKASKLMKRWYFLGDGLIYYLPCLIAIHSLNLGGLY